MVQKLTKNQKIVIVLMAVITALITILVASRTTGFRVDSVIPEPKNTPSSATSFFVFFSEPIVKESVSVRLEPNSLNNIVVDDKSVRINLSRGIDIGSSIDLFISATSKEGDELSEKITFIGKYVAPKDQPKILRDIALEQSDSFENNYPLINILPVISESFSINFEYPYAEQTRLPIIITVNTREIPRPSKGTSETNKSYKDYVARVRQGRIEAINYLEENGTLDLSIYRLVFTEPFLQEEFKKYF